MSPSLSELSLELSLVPLELEEALPLEAEPLLEALLALAMFIARL